MIDSRKRLWSLLLGVGCGVALAGCGQPASAPSDGAPGNIADSGANAAGALAPADVSLQVADGALYEEVLKKHQGKVVLVDFWATWCDPCREQFPHTVSLARAHGDDGLAVVSVSMDDPESEAKVRKFLALQGADFDNLVSEFGNGTASTEAFDLPGDVPVYKLYDRAGKLRYQFSGYPEDIEHGEPIEKIDERVEELLAEAA